MAPHVTRFVKKKPSGRTVISRDSKVQLQSSKATTTNRHQHGFRKPTLKRPVGVRSSTPIGNTWHEFTPEIIDDMRCLARTWDNGLGGQCERRPVNADCKLCYAHLAEDKRPQGLTHGLVTGEIPVVKLKEFQSVRDFRQRTNNEPSIGPGVQQVGQIQVVKGQPAKAIISHRRPHMYFNGKIVTVKDFEQIAMDATEHVSEYLSQRVSYPVPIVGSISCTLFGFERDLDGIRPNTICIYEWRFVYKKINGFEATHHSKYKCRSLLYKKPDIQIPWQLRTMACLVDTSVALLRTDNNYCNGHI